jgi:hypothetical protein
MLITFRHNFVDLKVSKVEMECFYERREWGKVKDPLLSPKNEIKSDFIPLKIALVLISNFNWNYRQMIWFYDGKIRFQNRRAKWRKSERLKEDQRKRDDGGNSSTEKIILTHSIFHVSRNVMKFARNLDWGGLNTRNVIKFLKIHDS